MQKRKRGETSSESKDEDENTRSSKRVANQDEIVGAAPPTANLNPAPQSQGQKWRRTESLEDEEQNTRHLERQEFSDNVLTWRFWEPAIQELFAGCSLVLHWHCSIRWRE